MLSRVWTNLLFVASVLVLGGVGYYFANEYWSLASRRQGLDELNRILNDMTQSGELDQIIETWIGEQ